MTRKIAIAADHRGFKLKQNLIEFLQKKHFDVTDYGPDSEEPVDYPDHVQPVAELVSKSDTIGILICNSGIGMSIAANRFKNVRAALCHDEDSAQSARQHNNANILVLGAKCTDEKKAQKLVTIFLETPFNGGKHAKRLEKISKICS